MNFTQISCTAIAAYRGLVNSVHVDMESVADLGGYGWQIDQRWPAMQPTTDGRNGA
jgi:hypothetical protein